MDIDAGEGISFEPGRMPNDRVDGHEKSRPLFLLELGDTSFGLILLAFFR